MMRKNKNMIKDNNRVSMKPARKKEFYVIVEEKVKMKDGSTETKSFVDSFVGSRMEAKNELEGRHGKKITYFGAVV